MTPIQCKIISLFASKSLTAAATTKGFLIKRTSFCVIKLTFCHLEENYLPWKRVTFYLSLHFLKSKVFQLKRTHKSTSKSFFTILSFLNCLNRNVNFMLGVIRDFFSPNSNEAKKMFEKLSPASKERIKSFLKHFVY